MSAERRLQIETLFEAARNRPDGERAAFLAQACDDDELRREIESLLAYDSGAKSFLDVPAIDLVARAHSRSDDRRLPAGSVIGGFQIIGLIGEGGMGEVYRARDSKLKRDVAIKILPEGFALDAERGARFQREAEVLASLNHPHIASIYDLGESAESQFLVLELVEGQTLADRIAEGPIPIKEALQIAKQIAEALEAAHEQGIVHRDLKPANIKLSKDGNVKVLDFGLAKMRQVEVSGVNPSDSPTLNTATGVILGTAAYMSPEQARGKDVDKRADIWAFGVVLYELLTGKLLFAGEDVTETLAKVIQSEPNWAEIPKSVHRLLKKCLEKDPKRRLRDIGDAWGLLDPADDDLKSAGAQPRRAAGWVAAAVAIVIAGIAFWAPWRSTTLQDRPLVRLDVDLGPDVANFAISPDGMRLVWAARVEASWRLFTRRLDQPKATELPGTEGACCPFFSPDGQWIGFFNKKKLNKISVEGGAVVPIADTIADTGFWAEDNYIYTNQSSAGLSRVPSGGGTITNVTELDNRKEVVHEFAQLLPGAKAVLFTAYAQPLSQDTATIEVVTLADHHRTVLVRGVYGRFLPTSAKTGHLVFGSQDKLFAVPFDPEELQVTGTAISILDNISFDGGNHFSPQIEFSGNGTAVYRQGTGGGGSPRMATVQWLDNTGKTQPLLTEPKQYRGASLSPEGKRLALQIHEGVGVGALAGSDISVYDLERDTTTKLTFSGSYTGTVWSPNGEYIVTRNLVSGMHWMRSDGSGQPQPLTQTRDAIQTPTSFSSDSKRLAFVETNFVVAGPPQIWTVPLEQQDGQLKAGKPEQFLKTKSSDTDAQFSPDGRWLAYTSDESGKAEVYVRPFPLPASGQGGKVTISSGGGSSPRWSRVGNELMYRAGNQVMAVRWAAKGETFVHEKRRVWKKLGGPQAFSPDGKRIAVVVYEPAPAAPPPERTFVFLQNFFDELRRRVPLPN